MSVLLFDAVRPRPIAPRAYRGNMCGVRVAGLPPVPGGAADTSLVLSWFIDRYSPEDRQRIYAAWADRGCVDVLLSWPDSRSIAQSPAQFVATCQELVQAGFLPCVMGCSKDIDSPDVPTILASINQVLPLLVSAGVMPRFCIGWELSLWLSPTQVQQLIDALAPDLMAQQIKVFVHFQEGYFSFQQPGHVGADFWNLNVGKLTGILHQRDLSWDKPMYQARIIDCLQRFDGQFGYNRNGGLWDFIALEITAAIQFNGQMSETDGNWWGRTALATTPVNGVCVQGSGNGQ